MISFSLRNILGKELSRLSLTGSEVHHSLVRTKLRDIRTNYHVKREPPIGPHKKLAPYVKLSGRVGEPGNYHRIIHYPEDGKYTIAPLKVTKLSGRCEETGRRIIGGVGGGNEQKARWIDWQRLPEDWDPNGPDLEEIVLLTRYDPLRKPMIAKTAYGNKVRWQLATEGMKAGDIIRTSGKIPENPVFPVPGNSYPVGALPVGTEICMVQMLPGDKEVKVVKNDESAVILRNTKDLVTIKLYNYRDFAISPKCQCVVGKVSIHPLKALEIGSPNRLRWLGVAPRSGLWHRKDGRFGRKIKKPPPVEEVKPKKPRKNQLLLLHSPTEGMRGRGPSKKRDNTLAGW